MSDSAREHKADADARVRDQPVSAAILTVSDTRDSSTDRSGPIIREALDASGCSVVDQDIVRDEPEDIRARIDAWVANPSVEVIITTGGTGFSRRDTTVDVIQSMITTEVVGFGETFRAVSFQQIGPPAMLSRAIAGMIVSDDASAAATFVFVLPGSTNAVSTAMDLITPILAHLVVGRRA